MIIWIIGKSGSGKTYLMKKLSKKLKNKKKIFLLDGDEFRKYISFDLRYSYKDRKNNSKRIQNFCKYMDKNGFNVICSIVSIFPDHQRENRKIFKNYFQIYIKVESSNLIKRNVRGIYSKRKHVVGKDIRFPEPYYSNYVIENKFNKKTGIEINKIVKKIYARLY